MKKAEPQHNQSQNQPAQRQGNGAALESPQGEQIAQLEAVADASPQAGRLVQLAAMAKDSPRMAAQRKAISAVHNSPKAAAQRQQIGSLTGETAQREETEEPLQPKVAQRKEAPAKPNNTSLPDNLKNGIESLSGISMDSVKVHYNSSQPAQLNALAYAQGTDIHVAPGQEQYLPHEAWHVVQQAQGRVRPTTQMKEGVPVNDDQGLEREADVMEERAAQIFNSESLIPRALVSAGERTAQRLMLPSLKENERTRFFTSPYLARRGELAAQRKVHQDGEKFPMATKDVKEWFLRERKAGKYSASKLDVLLQFAENMDINVPFKDAVKYAEQDDGLKQYLLSSGYERPELFAKRYQNAFGRYEIGDFDIDWKSAYDKLALFSNDELEATTEAMSELHAEREEVLGKEEDSRRERSYYTRQMNKMSDELGLLKKSLNLANSLKEEAVEISLKLIKVIKDPKLSEGRSSRSGNQAIEPPSSLRSRLDEIRKKLKNLLDSLQGNLGTARSMSAKGRAHDRDGIVENIGVNAQSSLFNLIKVDGDTPANVFKPSDMSYEVPEGVLTLNNKKLGNVSEKDTLAGSPKIADQLVEAAKAIDKMPKATEQKVIYRSAAIKKDRGAGQAPAMNNTNAAGYAFAKGLIKKGTQTSDWEWLHIRAASLGGETNSTNLLPGLSDANTLMMPVESHINELTKISGPLAETEVTFSPEGAVDGGSGHVYRYIKLDWNLKKIPNPFSDEKNVKQVQQGEAKFDITEGRVVAKKDIELLEGHLKEKRQDLSTRIYEV